MLRVRFGSRMALVGITAATLILAACGGGEPPAQSTTPSAATSDSAREQPQADAAGLEVHRFAKISSGAYFYTASELEKRIILEIIPDMRYEGVGFYRSEGDGTTPVFRFANLLTGGYFYTANPEERDLVINTRSDMRFEGTSFSAAAPGDIHTKPVYRLANLTNGAYLYTTSAAERSLAVGMGIWRDEKTAFRAKDVDGGQPSLAAGRYHTCAARTDGTAYCWGYNDGSQVKPLASPADANVLRPVRVEGVSDVTSLALGESFSCALLRGGSMKCWGRNSDAQLGIGEPASATAYPPTTVSDTRNAAAMVAGRSHGCALTDEWLVRCWGQNENGQLGADTVNGQAVTVQQIASVSALSLAAGNRHTCAVLVRGSVQCWGNNYFGQLGATFAASQPPREVAGIDQAVAVSAGEFHTCALLRNGTVQCWGWNFYDQLGYGGPNTDQPRPIDGITDAVAIASGNDFSCALRAGGQVLCWGSNDLDQMGNGQPRSQTRYRPGPVAGIGSARAITAGFTHACALLREGTVQCWGYNAYGALGNGTTNATSTPVTVLDPSGQGPLRLF